MKYIKYFFAIVVLIISLPFALGMALAFWPFTLIVLIWWAAETLTKKEQAQ